MKNRLKEIYLVLRTIALTAAGPFLRRGPRRLDPAAVKRILVIRIDRLGDFALNIPFMRSVAATFPDAEITMVTTPYTAELARNFPYVKEVVVYDGNKVQTTWAARRQFARGFRGRFDMVIDPSSAYTLETALLSYWTGAPWRMGFDVSGRGVFFNLKTRLGHRQHFIDQTLSLLDVLGLDARLVREPQVIVSGAALQRVDSFLQSRGVRAEDTLVGIHIGGNYPSQRWMPEGFAAVADELARRDGVKILLFAGAAEQDVLRRVTGAMSVEPIVWEGGGIEDFAGAIGRCRLLVCNNSGPLHLAVALGVPTVSTMGPTVPWMWTPRGEKNIVIRRDLPCSPCTLGECPTHECMKSITTQEILEAAQKLLALFHPNANSNTICD